MTDKAIKLSLDEEAKVALEKMFFDSFDSAADDTFLITLKEIAAGQDDIVIPEKFLIESEDDDQEESSNLYVLIQEMKLSKKIKLAMFGNKLARNILIKDSNKQVSLVVLTNNRLTEGEINDFAKNTNLDVQVHRAIARNAQWMKNYSMKYSVVSNPKVPVDISMKYVKYLNNKDLKTLSRSKNIPQVVATMCKKALEKRQK